MTTIGKRPFHALTDTQLHQSSSVCKRPRCVPTPTSAISVVTTEDDVISTKNSSLLDYQLPSPTYNVSFGSPLQSPSYSPPATFTPINHQIPLSNQHSEDYSLRSEDQIGVDVENSFATGCTGPVESNNDMLIHVLTNDIEDLCYINDRNPSPSVNDQYHNFFSQYKQPFELEFYIRRLIQYSNCSSAAFIVMLVYLDRIQEKCKQLLITEMNCHRLLCTSLVLAIKYLDDEVFSNSYYARVGGVTSDEMNELELKLLNILDWDLSVSPETFALYEEGLIESSNALALEQFPCSPTSAA